MVQWGQSVPLPQYFPITYLCFLVLYQGCNLALICLIHKNGANYRAISLLTIALKVLEAIIRGRMSQAYETFGRENQAGIRAKRGSRDRIFSPRQIIMCDYYVYTILYRLVADRDKTCIPRKFCQNQNCHDFGLELREKIFDLGYNLRKTSKST